MKGKGKDDTPKLSSGFHMCVLWIPHVCYSMPTYTSYANNNNSNNNKQRKDFPITKDTYTWCPLASALMWILTLPEGPICHLSGAIGGGGAPKRQSPGGGSQVTGDAPQKEMRDPSFLFFFLVL